MTACFGRWLGGVVTLSCTGALLACSAGDAQREEGAGPTVPSASGNPYAGASRTTGAPGANTGAAGTSSSTAPGSETGPNPTQVAPGSTGSNSTGNTGSTSTGTGTLGSATMGGTGQSSDRYQKADVTRDGKNYFFMSNG